MPAPITCEPDEHVRVEEALRLSEERFRIVADSTYDWEFWLSPQGDFLYCSPSCLRVTGYTAAEFEADPTLLHRTIVPEDRERFLAHERRNDGQPGTVELRMVHRDGSVRWIEHVCQPVYGADGQHLGSRGSNREVTERKVAEAERERLLQQLEEARAAAEAALSQARARADELDTVIATAPDGLILYDANGLPLRTNAAARSIMGMPDEFWPQPLERRAEAVAALGPDGNRLAPDDLPTRRALRGERVDSQLVALHLPGKGVTWALCSAAPVLGTGGEVRGAVTAFRDVTELRQSQLSLEHSNAEMEAMIAAIPDGIIHYDSEGRILRINARAESLLGYAPGEQAQTLSQRSRLGQVVGPDGKPIATTQFASARALKGETVRLQQMAVQYTGRPLLWLSVNAAPIRTGEGAIAGAVSTIQDVTTRVMAEQALDRERQRLSITLRSIGDGVIATDAEARIAIMNPAAETMTGWTEAEALGRPTSDVLMIENERTGERIADPVTAVLASGMAQGLANHAVLVARDGTRHTLADSAAPIREEQGVVVGAVLVFQDVTERRYLEEERAKVNKLESLGVLAGGIAHDFNNLLTGILGNVMLARTELTGPPDVLELLVEAEQASIRAKSLTQQLLTFARGGEPVKRTVALPELLRDATTFALRGSTVTASFDLPPGLSTVEADPGQISQVVQNLVINARDAMPEGGEVAVSAANVTLSHTNALPLGPGAYVRITVADTGHGIPNDLRGRIFDPYFTTKQTGSGLGLAVVYSVVVKHDGYVTVESEVGRGSRFHVYLPRVTPGSVPPPVLGADRKARVLVMDDDDIVLRVAAKMLTRLGYEVATATDGAAAVDSYRRAREAGTPFDAVILDLYVPGGMGGLETLARLRAFDVGVRAIVCSGYSSDRVMAQYGTYGFLAAMDKPYTMEALRQVVESVVPA